jgi:hypothetical protein
MWTLFVVTLLPQINDVKVTRYDEYETKQECLVEMIEIQKEFTFDEDGMCIELDVSKPKPVNDNK